MNRNLLTVLAATAAMSPIGQSLLSELDSKSTIPKVDIESEFELIKQKKSKLSASKRRWVVRQAELKGLT